MQEITTTRPPGHEQVTPARLEFIADVDNAQIELPAGTGWATTTTTTGRYCAWMTEPIGWSA